VQTTENSSLGPQWTDKIHKTQHIPPNASKYLSAANRRLENNKFLGFELHPHSKLFRFRELPRPDPNQITRN
jgi:hypothetical protein